MNDGRERDDPYAPHSSGCDMLHGCASDCPGNRAYQERAKAAQENPCTEHPGRENHCWTGRCGRCWLCKEKAAEVCGAENPDYPGEYFCDLPKGHGNISHEHNLFDHAYHHEDRVAGLWNMPETPETSVTYVVQFRGGVSPKEWKDGGGGPITDLNIAEALLKSLRYAEESIGRPFHSRPTSPPMVEWRLIKRTEEVVG